MVTGFDGKLYFYESTPSGDKYRDHYEAVMNHTARRWSIPVKFWTPDLSIQDEIDTVLECSLDDTVIE